MSKWELEFRRTADTASGNRGDWLVRLRGSLEDCLEDLMQFRAGQYGEAYDAARLTIERPAR